MGSKFVDPSDVVGASPTGAAPTTFSFLTSHLASIYWAKTTARRDQKQLSFQFNSIQYRLLSHNKYIYKYSKKIRKGT